MNVTKPKLRWFQFTVRSLLVLMTSACIVLAWAGPRIRMMLDEAEREVERKAQLKEMEARWARGTHIMKRIGGRLCPNSDWAPGKAYVFGFKKQFSDDGIKQLKCIPEIGYLDLSETQVTDKGLVHLTGMKQLKSLQLSETNITDVGLNYLKGLTALEELSLDGTKVTEVGVKNLKQALPKCTIEL